MKQRILLFLVVFALFASLSRAGDLVILPGVIELDHAESRQHVLLQEKSEDTFRGNVTGVEWTVDRTNVVEWVDGVLVPKGNGVATLTARTKDGIATTEVRVNGYGEGFSWSFNRHVLPVLTRQGCNMGACHGAVAGKGGFRLSLRGYDPPADFYTLTREARGRRIEMADPARSLLLTKPTMATPHKGGKRLEVGSREYRILAEWVAEGASAPGDEEVAITHIEVMPDLSILRKGDRQPLLVTAHYSDGTAMDVTDWAQFNSADEAVAIVDETGVVEVIGYGEGAESPA
ncbi:MAG: S-layer protein, partial [Verrucomicrobiota bacterium]